MPKAGEFAALESAIIHDFQQLGTGAAVGEIPIGTPIALLFIAAALIFIPSVLHIAGGTLFGTAGQTPFGTIEHDFQQLGTDIVGILHHPEVTAF
jgi:hypothetical protein